MEPDDDAFAVAEVEQTLQAGLLARGQPGSGCGGLPRLGAQQRGAAGGHGDACQAHPVAIHDPAAIGHGHGSCAELSAKGVQHAAGASVAKGGGELVAMGCVEAPALQAVDLEHVVEGSGLARIEVHVVLPPPYGRVGCRGIDGFEGELETGLELLLRAVADGGPGIDDGLSCEGMCRGEQPGDGGGRRGFEPARFEGAPRQPGGRLDGQEKRVRAAASETLACVETGFERGPAAGAQLLVVEPCPHDAHRAAHDQLDLLARPERGDGEADAVGGVVGEGFGVRQAHLLPFARKGLAGERPRQTRILPPVLQRQDVCGVEGHGGPVACGVGECHKGEQRENRASEPHTAFQIAGAEGAARVRHTPCSARRSRASRSGLPPRRSQCPGTPCGRPSPRGLGGPCRRRCGRRSGRG